MTSSPCNLVSESHSARLSWDGTLCQLCRELLDSLQASHRDIPVRSDVTHAWCYDYKSLRENAKTLCRLCTQVVKAIKMDDDISEDFLARNPRILCTSLHLTPSLFHYSITVKVDEFEADDRTESHDQGYTNPDLGQIAFLLTVRRYTSRTKTEHERQSESNAGQPEALEKVKRWMALCQDHKNCNLWRSALGMLPTLPTRLIRIDQHTTPPKLKLVEGKDLSQIETRYMTLSHCWGKVPLFKLTRLNMLELQSSIPWDAIPKTFKEACMFTQALHVQYLWIDALCIIQNDREDWAIESGSMASVYANSLLNLSADDSSDNTGGLFRNPTDTPSRAFSVPFEKSSTELLICDQNDWTEEIEGSPINTRAWVVQERVLAPRVLHFTKDAVRWECCTLASSEHVPDDHDEADSDEAVKRVPATLALDSTSRATDHLDVYGWWRKLLFLYMRSELTNHSDRPIAIAGLARAFCGLLGVDETGYVCGFWQAEITKDLCWTSICNPCASSPFFARREVHGSPSWSWLASGSKRHKMRPSSRHGLPLTELIAAASTPVRDAFGTVSSSQLKLRGRICPIQLVRRKEQPHAHALYAHCCEQEFLWDVVLLEEDGPRRIEARVFLDPQGDEGIQDVPEQLIYVLAGSVNQRSRQNILDATEDTTKSEEWRTSVNEQVGGSEWIKGENHWITTYTQDEIWPRCLQCLMLIPSTMQQGAFIRVGRIDVGRAFGRPAPKDQVERRMRDLETYQANITLARSLRDDNVPAKLYEERDGDGIYTFNLV